MTPARLLLVPLALAALLVTGAGGGATAVFAAGPAAPDDPAGRVADALEHALRSGDAAAVRALLLPEALIFESGGAESSAAEYAAHHLPADMAFLASMRSTRVARSSGGDGATAWVATRSRTQGSYKGRQLDLDNTETLVLVRRGDAWRIAHIHWSSAAHRGEAH